MEERREIYRKYGVSDKALDIAFKAESAIEDVYKRIDYISEYNSLKVLNAFKETKFSEVHMGSTTGYGYDDIGREKLEEIYAKVFGAEKAYVRMQISSGTQAITAMLFGLLRPGDTMLSVTGKPYDTLSATIGLNPDNYDGSLLNFGIKYKDIELLSDSSPDIEGMLEAMDPSVKMIFIQKSRGYTGRRALLSSDIEKIAKAAHEKDPDVIVCVDNCYGEFCELKEPCEVGADICAGSLIKNPGGGIAPTGGYIAGKADLVEKCARHLTTPGLGSEVGPTLDFNRQCARGLFTAPATVRECLKGAVFAAAVFELCGIRSLPAKDEIRGDIVQTLIFEDPDKMVNFCRKIQECSPVDSYVTPEPWDMPGYDDQVIMAAGTFISGATTELSCDGPMKDPYIAYMQGGLVSEQVKLAVLLSID